MREEVLDVLPEALSYLVSDLNPFTEYTFRVTAFTVVGEGPAKDITEKTREQGERSDVMRGVTPFKIIHMSSYALNCV